MRMTEEEQIKELAKLAVYAVNNLDQTTWEGVLKNYIQDNIYFELKEVSNLVANLPNLERNEDDDNEAFLDSWLESDYNISQLQSSEELSVQDYFCEIVNNKKPNTRIIERQAKGLFYDLQRSRSEIQQDCMDFFKD